MEHRKECKKQRNILLETDTKYSENLNSYLAKELVVIIEDRMASKPTKSKQKYKYQLTA